MKTELTITLKRQVTDCLRFYPGTRDSDVALVFRVWNDYHRVEFDTPFRQIYNSLLADEIPSWESITRCRRMIQAEREELAGNREKRVKRQEEIKEQIQQLKLEI